MNTFFKKGKWYFRGKWILKERNWEWEMVVCQSRVGWKTGLLCLKPWRAVIIRCYLRLNVPEHFLYGTHSQKMIRKQSKYNTRQGGLSTKVEVSKLWYKNTFAGLKKKWFKKCLSFQMALINLLMKKDYFSLFVWLIS